MGFWPTYFDFCLRGFRRHFYKSSSADLCWKIFKVSLYFRLFKSVNRGNCRFYAKRFQNNQNAEKPKRKEDFILQYLEIRFKGSEKSFMINMHM